MMIQMRMNYLGDKDAIFVCVDGSEEEIGAVPVDYETDNPDSVALRAKELGFRPVETFAIAKAFVEFQRNEVTEFTFPHPAGTAAE